MDGGNAVKKWYAMCQGADVQQCGSCLRIEQKDTTYSPHQQWLTPVLNSRGDVCHDWMPGPKGKGR